MKYSFQILSEENDNFLRVIEIDENDTFLSLNKIIQKSVGYDKEHLASFYTVDDNWDKETEISQIDLSDDDDDEVLLMDKVKLNTLLKAEGDNLLYVFDFLGDRALLCMLDNIIPGDSKAKYPRCIESVDDAPEQLSDDDSDSEMFFDSDLKNLEKEFSQLVEKSGKGSFDDLYDDMDDYDDLDSNKFDNIDDYADRF